MYPIQTTDSEIINDFFNGASLLVYRGSLSRSENEQEETDPESETNEQIADSWSNLPEIKEQLKKEFDKWTSGNVNIDEIIQKSQLEAFGYFDILEWIDYSKLKNFEYTGFGDLYKANWLDGCISYWSNGLKRYEDVEVGLQYINEENLHDVLILTNKYLMMTDKSNINRLFGFSLDPEKNKYALVINYEKIQFLEQHLKENTLDWSEKYRIIIKIATILKNIHEKHVSLDYFNPQNILIDEMDYVEISIFGGFRRENNIAYTAPEILQTRRENDQSSDIYALGMIFYRIVFEQEPFVDIKDESQLKNEIINGVRPQFLQDIPYFLKELILKCWDANPSNRPTIHELENILLRNSTYEFQYYSFSLEEPSSISERFYKNLLEYNVSASFLLYSARLLKSIKSGSKSCQSNYSDNNNYINFYPIKGNKHIFKKFRTDNYENEIDVINQNQITDIQKFSGSCVINNISSATMPLCDGNVKVIIKELKNDENQSFLLKKQLNYWNAICKYHENIVEFIGIINDGNKISLILPYAHEGNLREYLKKKEAYEEDSFIRGGIETATNIADGLLYIHKDLDIIHENLHPKNILMFNGIAKISDLPLPYDKNKFSYYDKYLFDNIGYIDPNLLLNKEFKKDKSMDIYNLGTLLWEIMSGKVPYSKGRNDGISKLVLKIKNNGYREEDISDISAKLPLEYINLYKKCWNGDSLARPKIDEIYEELLDIYNLSEIEIDSVFSLEQTIAEEPVDGKKRMEYEGNDNTKLHKKRKPNP